MVKLRREVEALEKDRGVGVSLTALQLERDRLQSVLAVLSERYAPDHPDVVSTRRQLATLENELQKTSQQQAQGGGDRPVNPAYIQLQAQLKAARAEIAAISRQREAIAQQIGSVEKLVLQTPLVERDYNRLVRAYESAVADYSVIKEKQKTAQLGEALETERKGERFSLVEPPQVPTEPTKPKRWVFVGLGAVLALASGFGMAALRESLDTAVYGPRQLAALTGASPLVVIPYIRTRAEIRRARRERLLYAGGAVAVILVGIAVLHTQIVPLDVLWLTTQRWLETVPVFARLAARV